MNGAAIVNTTASLVSVIARQAIEGSDAGSRRRLKSPLDSGSSGDCLIGCWGNAELSDSMSFTVSAAVSRLARLYRNGVLALFIWLRLPSDGASCVCAAGDFADGVTKTLCVFAEASSRRDGALFFVGWIA